MSEWSYYGAISTTSMPQIPARATIRRAFSASRGSRPPGSGMPVPSAKPGSTQPISKDRNTASAAFQAHSSAISIAQSNEWPTGGAMPAPSAVQPDSLDSRRDGVLSLSSASRGASPPMEDLVLVALDDLTVSFWRQK